MRKEMLEIFVLSVDNVCDGLTLMDSEREGLDIWYGFAKF